jgi:hypothetical protein
LKSLSDRVLLNFLQDSWIFFCSSFGCFVPVEINLSH